MFNRLQDNWYILMWLASSQVTLGITTPRMQIPGYLYVPQKKILLHTDKVSFLMPAIEVRLRCPSEQDLSRPIKKEYPSR